jgi:hypothetical protein
MCRVFEGNLVKVSSVKEENGLKVEVYQLHLLSIRLGLFFHDCIQRLRTKCPILVLGILDIFVKITVYTRVYTTV